MNFRDQLFHSSPFSSSNNILKFGDKITLENILFISKFINRQVSSIFYDWLTFSGNLKKYETWCFVTNHLNIPTFRTHKYGSFSIRASAISLGTIHKICKKLNLSPKNSSLKSLKYFLKLRIFFIDLIFIYKEFVKLYTN